MKRLCIYLTYDKQNIVDRYIGYMLNQLNTCVSYLVVVCNETGVARGSDILEKYADEIFYRENTGLDVGGWKDALCHFIGWEKVLSFDELVLVNDSFFGPFCPMAGIFDEMGKRNVDFWGLSRHGARKDADGTVYPPHIQSFFLAVGTDMLHCKAFQDYWIDMPYHKTYGDVVMEHESRFTEYFAGLGFTYDCLADMEPNDSDVAANNFNQYGFLPYELIRKRNFPFLKKQPLTWNTLHCQTQQNLRQALDYIDRETDYDINLIWDNIIRTLEMSDLQRNLHLQYVMPAGKRQASYHGDIVVAVTAEYAESAEYVMEYLENMEGFCKVKVYSRNLELLDLYGKNNYECVFLDHGTRNEKLLKELSASKLVCILHDSDVTGKKNPSCTGKSFFYHVWENLLKDSSHVEHINRLFDREPRLGMVSPPEPNFGQFFGTTGVKWGGYFRDIKESVEKLGLRCPVSYGKPPFACSDSFWIRGEVLKRMCGKSLEVKEAILPYLWCCMAQDAGYYSGVVESSEYASVNGINLQYYMKSITGQLKRQYGAFNSFTEMSDLVFRKTIRNFIKNLKHLYIYGTGTVAKTYQGLFPCCEAYVVSDGQPRENEMNGIRVVYLSELEVRDDAGILVCTGEENQREIIPLLEEKGWKNYQCV